MQKDWTEPVPAPWSHTERGERSTQTCMSFVPDLLAIRALSLILAGCDAEEESDSDDRESGTVISSR